VDWIFLSNSYWLDDEFPCLTYGLRGVIHAAVEISSGRPDTHSGVEGGSVREPLIDLINLLSCLTDKGRVTLNGFYDDVRPLTPAEEKLYEAITKKTYLPNQVLRSHNSHQETSTLMSRWRFPSLTVHKIVTTGSSQGSVIPNRARALISIRIVPDQKLEHMVSLLKSTLYEKFKESESDNSLFVSIEQQVDWWLGDPENRGFKALEKAVAEEWRIDPLHIREVSCCIMTD
jgi:di- and tripeptidase